MSNSLQVFDTLGYHRARYAELAAGGWTSGHIAPPKRGKYERLTPSLGITVDVWDDECCCWRAGRAREGIAKQRRDLREPGSAVAASFNEEQVTMSLTDDPKHPGLGRGVDEKPVPMNDTYLVLSEAERAKGFVRPVRRSYRHVGIAGPQHPLRDLTDEEKERYHKYGYVKFEAYPESESSTTGRFWTQAQLDSVGKGCGTVTTMGQALAETYARKPSFYGATYCCGCSMHRPVGGDGEFVWEGTDERVGT